MKVIVNIINKILNMSKIEKLILISFLVLLLSVGALVSILLLKTTEKEGAIVLNKQMLNTDIPNVTPLNTKISASTLEEAENVIITVEEKLEGFDLYYYVEPVLLEILMEGEQDIHINQILEDTTKNTIDSPTDFFSYNKYEGPINIEENSKVYFVYGKEEKHSAKAFEFQVNNIVKALQEEEEVSEEEIKKEQVAKEKVVTGQAPYYIKVNYGANTVTIYEKDEEGNYTVPVKAMICSCGISTPKSGVYKTSRGFEWGTLMGGVYGQYSTRIVRNILFHSVPYTAMSKDSLEYWEFDKLGTKASAGCVRLMVEDARWIFVNCGSGTMVEFYSDSDPGPLGKPSAPKISDNERCRDWDPTDYVEGNPWLEKEENPQETVQPEPEIIPEEGNTASSGEGAEGTIPDYTAPDNTSSENTAPDNTSLEDTTPSNTSPEDTTPIGQENPPVEPPENPVDTTE